MNVLRWRDDWRAGAGVCLLATAALTAALAPFQSDLTLLNEGLLFLLLTLSVSAVWGVRVGVFAALLTNLALNFFFVPPLHRFAVGDPENVLALIAFLAVSLVAGSLVSAARSAADRARRRQGESEVLLRLTRVLIGQTDPQAALAALCVQVVATFQAHGAAVLGLADSQWTVLSHSDADAARPSPYYWVAGAADSGRLPDTEERSVAQSAVTSGRVQGLGHAGFGPARRPRIVLPMARRHAPLRGRSVTFVPLSLGERLVGVLRLDGPFGATSFRQDPERLLAGIAQEAALAVHRLELAQAAAHAEALRQANEMKGALLASISHDLKTPLATIKASVSSLLDSALRWSDQDKQAFLETIESQTDHLDSLISDLLALNRIQSGALLPETRPVHVRDLLEDALEAALPETRGRAVLLNPDDSLVVVTDRMLVRQALVNLLENASKYSPPESPVRLEAVADVAAAEIVVADEGPGIAASDLPYIFERFYRGGRERPRTSGTGLGLAIAKAFVESAGGTIRVKSSEAGSRFIVRLPLAVQPARIA